jgi:hypothetical protein
VTRFAEAASVGPSTTEIVGPASAQLRAAVAADNMHGAVARYGQCIPAHKNIRGLVEADPQHTG